MKIESSFIIENLLTTNQKIFAVKQRFTFSKNERLSGHKIMAELFAKGNSMVVSPFRLIWMQATLSSASPAQVAFSVPVKNFRLAVDRNRIKRQMREIYRKNKASIYSVLQKEKKQCALMIIFTSKTKIPFTEVENKLTITLQRFEEELKKHAK